jgi:dihydrofolate reductase
MRRLRYNVAASLDGFIADTNHGYDWLTMDESIDFTALFAQFDTFVMGRKTYDVLRAQGDRDPTKGREVIVFSRTLKPADFPNARVTAEDPAVVVRELKQRPGKDIWLFGGGDLFRQLLDAGEVDAIEVAVMPILLSAGIPILPAGERSRALRLTHSRTLPSGIVMLEYAA